MFNILITDPFPAEGLARLRAAPDVSVDDRPWHGPELLAGIAGYDALIVRSGTAVDRAVLERGERLKLVARAGISLDNIDLHTATARGIMVMNAPEPAGVSAAEHTLALLLALCRRLPLADAAVRRGEWQREPYLGVQLAGRTLGLIGLGRVGRRVAVRARALEMTVLACDPYVEEAVARQADVTLVTLTELLARSDVVSVHTTGDGAPRPLLGADELRQMKPGARLVNTARGDLVDEAALIAALEAGQLAGAALDVFAAEPPARSRLWELSNVVLTPHLGASTVEAQRAIAEQLAAQVLDALRGHNYHNVVNLPFLAGPDFRLARPYLELAEKLGALQAQLAGGPLTRLEVEVKGEGLAGLIKPIAVALVTGLLRPALGEAVNYVNAPALAAERGLMITQARSLPAADYPNLISCRVTWAGGPHAAGGPPAAGGQRLVAGTLFGGQDSRLVQVDGFRMDARPAGPVLLMASRDVPGVIGLVGTRLAEYHVNIAEWRLGRDTPGGTALSVINLDEAPPAAALDAIRALPQIISVWLVHL